MAGQGAKCKLASACTLFFSCICISVTTEFWENQVRDAFLSWFPEPTVILTTGLGETKITVRIPPLWQRVLYVYMGGWEPVHESPRTLPQNVAL